MGKDEILILINGLIEDIELAGKTSDEKFKLAVLMALKLILEKDHGLERSNPFL